MTPTTKVPNFGPTLKAFRERDSTLTQGKLAERAGFDHSTVGRLEAGTRDPSREVVVKLATALGLDATDTDRLLEAADYRPVSIAHRLALPALANLDAIYREADAETKRQIATMIDFIRGAASDRLKTKLDDGTIRLDLVVEKTRAVMYGADQCSPT